MSQGWWTWLRESLDRRFGYFGAEDATRHEENEQRAQRRARQDDVIQEIRDEEDATLKAERRRRMIARNALAQRYLTDAQRKRALAAAASEREMRQVLLREAEELERNARKLMGGEIGLLNAMGLNMSDDNV
jgi:hypothetical protein